MTAQDNQDAQLQAAIKSVVEQTGQTPEIVRQVIAALVHDLPSSPDSAEKLAVEAPGRTLPEIRLELNDADVKKSGVDVDKANNNHSKLGGVPQWIQSPCHPICCNRLTTFYAQIDSNLSDEFNLVDAGMVYVFVCDTCLRTHSELQYF